MGDDAPTPVDINQPSSPKKAWHSYISDDLPRSVQQSTDSAIRSARSIQDTSSTHLRTLQPCREAAGTMDPLTPNRAAFPGLAGVAYRHNSFLNLVNLINENP
ncbi:hypothetical protein FXO37_28400 [Capsicum annuum]|nr:hypothetical protein FXO37_28400 [Capsicum annuum]